jgi:hypothetical protein
MAAIAISVEHDVEGLQVALRELFEESFETRRLKASRLGSDPDSLARAIDDLDVRTLSPGYYVRASYLLDLSNAIETGVQYTASMLDRCDVLGLQAVKIARGEFQHDHPTCSACGERQESRFATRCCGCQVEFARGGK